MGIFGKRKREKFIRTEAANLANYLKNNAVKSGGEVYAKYAALRILPQEIDESLLWYFWVLIFSYRVALDMGPIKATYKKETYEELYFELCQIDNKHFSRTEHAPYDDTFVLVGRAADCIYSGGIKDSFKQASIFFLHGIKAVPYKLTQEQRFMIVEGLIEAAEAFPSLSDIVAQEA